ncbi:MAG: enoyl-CoA hydratase/isomerase family protein [Chloroflexi bacterium]|nr:enoyl-CoA hydratase/isomerase family protein [Chloroflexota bacterium]
MAYEFIEVSEVGAVMVITMDDPPTRNAIGTEMADEINQAIDHLESDASLRALVLTGRDPSFCSGANVKRMDQANRDRADEPKIPDGTSPWELLDERWDAAGDGSGKVEMDSVRFVPLRLHNVQKPSIAAVNGYAMGLGMGIALSCDMRIASENARFSETFIRRGLIPADGSCWQLPRMIGLSNTFMLQYTGDIVDAHEAHRLGMVNKVTPPDELMETTMDLAQRLANGPTYSMALIKRLIHRSLHTDLAESLRLAGPAQGIARSTEDHKEGVRAFVEKREPAYKGR